MTTTELCIHDMRAEWCADCNDRQPAGRYPDRTPAFPARYHGHCNVCDEPIEAGQDVTYDQDGGGGVIHWTCDVWDLEREET